MPHFPKPFFRAARGLWYVQIDGKQHNLGPDRDAAFDEYHRLMRQPKVKVRSDSLAVLIDQFLEWVSLHRAADTYEWYQSRLQLFAARYPDLTLDGLRPFHIQQWIDSYTVTAGTKRNYARSIMRCMSWAEEQGLIEKNPIRHFRKPRQGTRDIVISPDRYETIIRTIKRQPFKDLCAFAWETGARAAEILDAEKRHTDLSNHRLVFPVSEEKMERAPRIIYLNETAEAIIVRLMKAHPTGKLFRNTDGLAWTTDAVNCAFGRIEKKLGTKYCLTVFRHSFCHRMLKGGADSLTVSMLMGHSGVSMVAKVYSHLAHAPEYLREALKKGASLPPQATT